ncbi:hypothetical protein BBD39_10260 [Arsenophonus endosymbiont of Bemisia tabaci Asia II 3]|nr:hypothetical protein BBD39_10260 [Arsenophonus endosymbiont of Bemisia tabaci Asia II 3]
MIGLFVMKQHREIIPLFDKKFKCIGDQCLSHCCHGWTINIDKKTYKKSKTAHQIEIKEITDKHLIKYPKGSVVLTNTLLLHLIKRTNVHFLVVTNCIGFTKR